MAGTRKRKDPTTPKKNPGTPSPRKRSGRKAKAARIAPDVHFPGNMLQHTFKLAEVTEVSETPHATLAEAFTTGSSEPLQHPQSLSHDPFVAQQTVSAEAFQLSAITDGDENEPGAPQGPSDMPSPTPHQQAASKRASRPAGTKRAHMSEDVLMFFSKAGDRRSCTFCVSARQQDKVHRAHTYSMNTSTGTLRAHLIKYHAQEWASECKKHNLTVKSEAGLEALANYEGKKPKSKTNYPEFSQELFMDALTDFIIATDQPLSIVESQEFRDLLFLLRGEFFIPHRTTVRSRILERQTEHFESLATHMQKNSMGKVSFTMDMWSDPDRKAYMAVTAHWIERQSLQVSNLLQQSIRLCVDLLGFAHVPGTHSGERLAEVFLFTIKRLNIANKIGWITVDNAANNDTCMSALEETLLAKDIDFDSEERHIRCFPHIVNLACKAMIGAAAGSDSFVDPIKKLRDLIQHIRSSQLRRDNFQRALELLKMPYLQLIRDVDTRWSSTYLMIDRALQLKNGLMKYTKNDSQISLSDWDWKSLTLLHDILKIPHCYQQLLSAEKTPTLCGTLPAFEGLIRMLEIFQMQNISAFEIIQPGLEKLQNYQELVAKNQTYIIATLLNPSMNLAWFTEYRSGDIFKVKEILYTALQPYYIAPVPEESQSQSKDTQSEKKQGALAGLGLTQGSSHQEGLSLDDELRRYYSIQASADIDVLAFWQSNKDQFPTLFKLAMDYLSIQASSVPCERVFSSSKETTTSRRNKLAPDLVEALQMLKFSKKHMVVNFTECFDRDEEMAELETLEKGQFADDEDLSEMLQSSIWHS